MARKRLTEKDEALLRRAADTGEAKSYAEWLGGGQNDTSDASHEAHAKRTRREAVGYGLGGEALAKGDLADDGYAAYLREAAKEAREAGHQRIERERAGSQLAALSQYAEYLDSERKKKGDRLVALAEDLASNSYESGVAGSLIRNSAAGATATALLNQWQRYVTPYEETAEGRAEIADVLTELRRSGMPYKRAYEYCRLRGYSDALAARLARFAEAERSDLSQQLEELMKE